MKHIALVSGVLLCGAVGCASPYHTDRGAVFGGVAGAGVGALVGAAVGEPLAGAAIGAGVGTLTGAAVGSSLDDIEARNRAEIAARMGRPVPLGAVTTTDIIAMSQSGVSEEVIVTHVRNNGVAQPLQTNDLITLQNNGVSPRVIQAMQTSVPRFAQATVVHPMPAPPPIIVEEHYIGDPWYPPPPWYHHHHYHRRPRPYASWEFSYSRRR